METLFKRILLKIIVEKRKKIDGTGTNLQIIISSEYSGTQRKAQLFLDEKEISNEIHRLWKKIKTKKLKSLILSFNPIGLYDDHIGIYQVPYFYIRRGKRKPMVNYIEHESIPKEWSVNVNLQLSNTKTITPITKCVYKTLGYNINMKERKEFEKDLRNFIKSDDNSFNFHICEYWHGTI